MGKISEIVLRSLGYGIFFGVVGPPITAFVLYSSLASLATAAGGSGSVYLEMMPIMMLLSPIAGFFPAFVTGLVCGAMRRRSRPLVINVTISFVALIVSALWFGGLSGPIGFVVQAGPTSLVFLLSPFAAVAAHHWANIVAEASSPPEDARHQNLG
jgi:hypothetical protein